GLGDDAAGLPVHGDEAVERTCADDLIARGEAAVAVTATAAVHERVTEARGKVTKRSADIPLPENGIYRLGEIGKAAPAERRRAHAEHDLPGSGMEVTFWRLIKLLRPSESISQYPCPDRETTHALAGSDPHNPSMAKRIAVLGAGPMGLAVAYELVRL